MIPTAVLSGLSNYQLGLSRIRVLLAGYYGFGNTGDEAILTATIKAVSNRVGDAQIMVLSGNPEATAEQHRVHSLNRMSPIDVIRGLRWCDIVVFGGGSLLQDSTSVRSVFYYSTFLLLSRLMGKRILVYANGIGPLRTRIGRAVARIALNAASRITLRDPESLEELRRLGVPHPAEVTADPVFMLEPSSRDRARDLLARRGFDPDSKIVWLSLRNIKAPDWFYSELCQSILQMRQNGYNPAFILMQQRDANSYAMINSYLADHCQEPIMLIDGLVPEDVLAVLGLGEACIGLRLHALIMSARAGVPCLGIEIDSKIGAFCRMIENPVLPSPVNASYDLTQEISRLLEQSCALRARINEKLPELTRLAARNVDIVVEELLTLSRTCPSPSK